MAKNKSEAALIEEYLRSESSEKARQHLLYPFLQQLFPGKLKIEGDAKGADAYIEGRLIVESKTSETQWLEGFYQALHYHKKFGLTYSTIMVVAHKFVAIWKLNKLPEYATILAHTASVNDAPNKVGKDNAKKTQAAQIKEIKSSAFFWLDPKMLHGDIFENAKHLVTESYEVLKVLRNLDSDRLQINKHNFIQTIERMKPFFDHPIDAVHAFYTIVAFWDITSTAAINEGGNELRVIGFKGNRFSDTVKVSPKHIADFRTFIDNQYIFTNEGSGLTVDYYFSRFDEVIAAIDPEYVKQHGIFFTNDYLSKFALWFAQHHFPGNINENYIVFDPAGGSGNLVSSWRGKLKHKIVSELQPDLLRTIERRMKADPFHIETGFTIIPRTSDNKGLNFLDRTAQQYLDALTNELQHKNVTLDKPLAFLLNPPYKNTKENDSQRITTESNYLIDESIIDLVGENAVNERYLAFLGQIINLSSLQNELGLKPIVMVFTPTSWLIPRPDFKEFRSVWDKHFKYESGFIITSNEFFKLEGKWPLAFTMWTYEYIENRINEINLFDFTNFKNSTLNVNWLNDKPNALEKELLKITNKSQIISLKQKQTLREKFNLKLYDFIRTPTKTELESKNIVGGLPIDDERRKNNKTYGIPDSPFIGFMDNGTPVRIRIRGDLIRFSKNNNGSVWFRLDTAFKDVNKAKTFGGPADNRSYAAYDLQSAKATFTWFAISKALNGQYPVWANQYDLWAPRIPKKLQQQWYSLCFAFVLAENRCVVTRFEKDNPIVGAPEVFVDNPLCPTNKESFWNTTLSESITNGHPLAKQLEQKIADLYKYWNKEYTKGQHLLNVGLHNEPYFKYFNYPDFLTPHSGLIQIRKYAEQEGKSDLLQKFSEISELTKLVKAELYRLLVEDFKYFD